MGDFEFGSIYYQEVDKNDPPRARKRKIDKDGFVRPITPESPGVSLAGALLDKEESTFDHIAQEAQYSESANIENNQSQYFPDEPQTDFGTVDKDPNEGGAASQGHDGTGGSASVHNIIRAFHEGSKLQLREWEDVFRRSEEFEHQCPSKLDQLIREAKSLEESLVSQKNVLCQRLQGIGETLQM